tara:strand:+ start:4738 stop:5781 length:1044 start_codon:yes stop_codon:yes gene_type:complete
MKKILIVGNWAWDHCEEAFANALRKQDFEVIPFKINLDKLPKPLKLIPLNPFLKSIQIQLLETVRVNKPNFVFLWNATHVTYETVFKMSKDNAKIVTYSNDDPYFNSNKPLRQKLLWRKFLQYINLADFHFVYRPINIAESKKYTNAPTFLLPPYFIPEKFHNLKLSDQDLSKYETDVVFIGHYENDSRSDFLEFLHDKGIKIKLFGTGWNKNCSESFLKKFGNIARLNQEDYFKSLKASKICLSFLSKYNRDIYTRRCFEITGSGNLLLCERNEYMKSLFLENSEATYFSSKEELLEKINWLNSNHEIIRDISIAGNKKAYESGHSIDLRAKYFADLVTEKTDKSL